MIEGEAVVHRDKVEVKIKVRSEDILLSGGMSLIIDDRIAKAVIVKGAEAHKKFLLNGLILSDADGRRLTGKVSKVELFPIPDAGMLLEDLMAKTTVYTLEYPLAKPPASLGFRQNFHTGDFTMPVAVQLTVVREGSTSPAIIPVTEDEKPERISFDWSQPPAVVAAAKPTPAKPAAFASTEAFVYIQNDEVRVEILMPLAVLESWQPVPRASKQFLEIIEQAAARARLEAWLTAQNEVKIDGVIVKPRLGRLDFFGLDFQNFAAIPEAKRLPVANAQVGAILDYSTKGPPRHVELKWTLLGDRLPAVRAVVFAYDKGTRVAFTAQQPAFAWDSPGAPPLPKIESVSSQKGAADAAARSALAETLLRNIYRGFDYAKESDIYDALARSVSGDLLTDFYLKIKRGLIVQEQGGAVARVQEVKVTKSEPAADSPEGGFGERVTWQVTGTVEHWGHIHTRTNEYTADLGITPQENAWKIVSMKVVKQSQVRTAVSLRKL
jgi:hypothetical protein